MVSLTKERTLSSIHNISTLLTQYTSIDNVLESISQEIAYVFNFTRLIIFLVNKEGTLLECRHTYGFSPQEVKRARIPYRLADHDCVETKVIATGESVFADQGETPLQMTREDLHTLEMFANQATIIIENTRLQEQNQKKIRQLFTLQEVGQETSSTFDLDTLSQIVTRRALTLSARADFCVLYLRDESLHGMELAAEAVCPRKDDMEGIIPAIDTAIISRVAEQETPLIVQYCQHPGTLPAELSAERSLLAIPLVSEQQVFGVLALGSEKESAFSEDDMKVLTIFASHTASTIKNARLYSQIMTEKSFRENILESSPNGILSIDRNRKISSLNRRVEEIFGITRKDVLGTDAEEVFSGETARVINQAIEQHKVVDHHEVIWKNGNGEITVLGLTSSLLRDHQGYLLGALLIIRDLTREKEQEAMIRRVDRLASLGQLSAGIAHEIRNPLASIYFNVQLLEKRLELSPDTKDIMTDTCKGIDRIRTLVKGMLDYAKPSIPRLAEGSLLRILKETITLMRSQLHKKGIDVVLHAAEEPPDIILDAHQIQQVFVNLLLNSMEAMNDGGTITIEVQEEKAPENVIILRFMDQGEGVAEENLNRIFNPFFTTKTEGTGLGLSIVHRILEQHNATAEVFSEKDRGTSFTLKFPIANHEKGNVSLQALNS